LLRFTREKVVLKCAEDRKLMGHVIMIIHNCVCGEQEDANHTQQQCSRKSELSENGALMMIVLQRCLQTEEQKQPMTSDAAALAETETDPLQEWTHFLCSNLFSAGLFASIHGAVGPKPTEKGAEAGAAPGTMDTSAEPSSNADSTDCDHEGNTLGSWPESKEAEVPLGSWPESKEAEVLDKKKTGDDADGDDVREIKVSPEQITLVHLLWQVVLEDKAARYPTAEGEQQLPWQVGALEYVTQLARYVMPIEGTGAANGVWEAASRQLEERMADVCMGLLADGLASPSIADSTARITTTTMDSSCTTTSSGDDANASSTTDTTSTAGITTSSTVLQVAQARLVAAGAVGLAVRLLGRKFAASEADGSIEGMRKVVNANLSSSAAAASAAMPKAEEETWQVPAVPVAGAVVRIHGLQASAQYNGKLGLVTVQMGDRWGVALHGAGNKVVKIKATNMEVIPAAMIDDAKKKVNGDGEGEEGGEDEGSVFVTTKAQSSHAASSAKTARIAQAVASGAAGGTDDGPNDGSGPAAMHLLANLCFRCPAAQNAVLGMDGAIPLVLNHTRVDYKQPLIREWALFCVRNLCESNPQVQAAIGQYQLQGVAPNEELAKMGLEADLEVPVGVGEEGPKAKIKVTKRPK
jgi:ataxin-10